MVYRTIKYKGMSLKKLKSVIKEIEEAQEQVIGFEVETFEQYEK